MKRIGDDLIVKEEFGLGVAGVYGGVVGTGGGG
jgi:hypothetical protein